MPGPIDQDMHSQAIEKQIPQGELAIFPILHAIHELVWDQNSAHNQLFLVTVGVSRYSKNHAPSISNLSPNKKIEQRILNLRKLILPEMNI